MAEHLLRAGSRIYERKGFVVEGSRRGAVEVDGSFIDAILMARMIGPSA